MYRVDLVLYIYFQFVAHSLYIYFMVSCTVILINILRSIYSAIFQSRPQTLEEGKVRAEEDAINLDLQLNAIRKPINYTHTISAGSREAET